MVTVDSHPAGAPAWFELMARDGTAGRDFYTGLLGWGVQPWPREHGDYLVCTLGERAVAGIDEPTGPHAAVPAGWLVYFNVADADATAGLVAEAGGSIVVAPTDLPGAGRYLMARDPLGAVFGVWEARGHIGSGAVGEPGAPSWTELRVGPDGRDAATAFYTAVLGDGLPHALIRDIDGPVPGWVPFFGTADLEEAAAAAAAAGAAVGDRVDTPAGDGVLLVDPGGAHVGLVMVG